MLNYLIQDSALNYTNPSDINPTPATQKFAAMNAGKVITAHINVNGTVMVQAYIKTNDGTVCHCHTPNNHCFSL
jgi:hypothetical protein